MAPSVCQGMPGELGVLHLGAESVAHSLAGFAAFMLALVCDCASGNMCLLTALGEQVEKLSPQVNNKLLFLPDTCQAHGHQRCKALFKDLAFHTGRHFGLAKLLRLEPVLDGITTIVAAGVRDRVQRIVKALPSAVLTQRLRGVLDFRLDVSGAEARGGKTHKSVKDLLVLLEVVNGDTSSSTWVHWCSGGPAGAACCNNEEECKQHVAEAVLAVTYGKAEQVPGEGK